MRQRLFAAMLLAPLAACAAASGTSTGSTTPTDLRTSLARITLMDLQTAEADAKAHDDTLALMCYQYLAGELPSATAANSAAISGPISGFQHLRDLARVLDQGLSQDFQLNCAPLLSDARANLLKLGALGAGAAGSAALP
jgi:hypothetical protein